MDNSTEKLIARHEECFYIDHSKLPFTAYVYEGEEVTLHWHTYIELLYLDGCETEVQIGTKVYHGYPGDLYVFNSNQIHSTMNLGPRDKFRHWVIQFDPSLIYPRVSSIIESKYIFPFLVSNTNSYICIKASSLNTEVKEILSHILDEYKRCEPGFEIEIKGCILRIFAWLVRNKYVNLIDEQPIEHLIEMKELLYYLEEHYQERISVEMAAGMVSMSSSHFCRVFKKTTGKSFVTYLNFIRLGEAEKQLLLTDNTVVEIASDVGLANVTYFNRIFKREYGFSPSELRKQNCSRIKE